MPIVTYAFDKSFTDFFGSNGVAAVESAIAILNALPPASAIELTNAPPAGPRYNFAAEGMQLYDLKSAALALLVEHMGLGQPTRNNWDLRRWDPIFRAQGDSESWPTGTIPNLIIERNFDPDALTPSHTVNGCLFAGEVVESQNGSADVVELSVDPQANPHPAIADQVSGIDLGAFWWGGLTPDDLGGLRYLLNTNTINFETLLPDVHGAGTNASNFVNLAARPGIEKITFVRQEYDSLSGQAIPVTNQFVDTYITNEMAKHQSLERVVTKPDFLFSVADLGELAYVRTGTTNWWNSAMVTGATNQTGSGVIVPPVKIAFGKRGPSVFTTDDNPGLAPLNTYQWGSFDSSATGPIVYPAGTDFEGANELSIHLYLGKMNAGVENNVDWKVPISPGGTAMLEMSTNLVDWTPVTTVTNLTGSVTWEHWHMQPARFFRAVPQ